MEGGCVRRYISCHMGAKLADRGDHHISKTAVPVAVSKDIAVTLVER